MAGDNGNGNGKAWPAWIDGLGKLVGNIGVPAVLLGLLVWYGCPLVKDHLSAVQASIKAADTRDQERVKLLERQTDALEALAEWKQAADDHVKDTERLMTETLVEQKKTNEALRGLDASVRAAKQGS